MDVTNRLEVSPIAIKKLSQTRIRSDPLGVTMGAMTT